MLEIIITVVHISVEVFIVFYLYNISLRFKDIEDNDKFFRDTFRETSYKLAKVKSRLEKLEKGKKVKAYYGTPEECAEQLKRDQGSIDDDPNAVHISGRR